MSVEIWHNPRCSKSRTTLKLLQDNGVEPTVRLYLQDAPSKAEIEAALSALGIPAIDLVRTDEAEFRASGLTKDSPDADLIAAMVSTPKLIERPVVVSNGKARIGRPPEAVLDLLQG